jgi:deoxyribodipyrimidine photo-lyase
MLNKRIKKLNDISKEEGRSVLYIMSRDQRVNDNHALIAAQKHATELGVPVLVAFVLFSSVQNRAFQHFGFMLEGLKELENYLLTLNIPFIVKTGKAGMNYESLEKELDPAAIYFDFSPLKGPRKVKNEFIEDSKTPCYIVDTHNIVPVWEASNKEEVGARTIRKKIATQLDEYLLEPQKVKSQRLKIDKQLLIKNDWQRIAKTIKVDKLEDYRPAVKPGKKAAQKILKDFIENMLEDYADLRNDPAENHLSNLSAYFHFGQLSTLRVALEIKKKYPKGYEYFFEKSLGKHTPTSKSSPPFTRGDFLEGVAAFLEESIVRKELSDNFCFYNEDYDSLNGASKWAQKTLEDHKDDKREYIYTLEELEHAETHDQAWNAAQTQMTRTGKMHGYMRMYWAKKILEWTNTPATALRFAIELNDKYELDGYDPNGYVGCMWSIAGVHDRGWTEREIFGKIRYMNFNGLKRKFDIEKYITQWLS